MGGLELGGGGLVGEFWVVRGMGFRILFPRRGSRQLLVNLAFQYLVHLPFTSYINPSPLFFLGISKIKQALYAGEWDSSL